MHVLFMQARLVHTRTSHLHFVFICEKFHHYEQEMSDYRTETAPRYHMAFLSHIYSIQVTHIR